MAVEITVPPMGESITEAVVGKWYKNTGDAIQPDETLVSLETDKVTVDVPAPAGGTLAKIAHVEGDKVRVGEVLGTLSNGAAAQAAPVQPVAESKAAPAPVSEAQAPKAPEGEHAISATPVARKLITERHLDAKQIKGTGPGGRILKEDVLGHVEGAAAEAPAPAPTQLRSVPQPLPAPRAITEREERVRMTPLRRRVAERLLAAQSNAAILTTFNEVDMSAVMALRKRYAEPFQKRHGVKLGFMGFFVRASIAALRAFPQVNAEIDGEDVIFKHYHDIGVAVSGSRGLVVPVLRDADTLSMAELEKGIGDYAQRARSDKLTLAELQGGTFTITNGGVFGSMLSTPILNPPQSAILGMHNIVERPVARDGQVVIRPVMYVALSYDHRLVDGREAVQFLVRIKECIEDPERLLLEV